nr:hypothetical protein [Pectobacterium brasiliense]
MDESAVEWSIRRILEGNPVLRTRFDLDRLQCLEGDYPIEAIPIERLTAFSPDGGKNTLSDRRLLELISTPENGCRALAAHLFSSDFADNTTAYSAGTCTPYGIRS